MAKAGSDLKARIAKGFRDLGPEDLRHRAQMLETIRTVYERYGYEPLETPAVEYVDALGKFLPEADQPDEGVFAFKDGDDQWLALRYDLTAPLSRYVAERWGQMGLPFRRYQTGPVYRNEKPGPGRYREFFQFDVDTIGAGGMAADAESAAIMVETMEALGLEAGDFEVRVNNRKILDGVLEAIGLTGKREGTAADPTLPVLRSIDKFDRLGAEGVRELLTTGREDESGDFTKGAGLNADQAQRVLDFMAAGGGTRTEVVAALAPLVGDSEIGAQGLQELRDIDAILTALGLGEDRVVFDPSIVRGLAYYTGPVLEVAATFETLDEKGNPRQFGSVAGGGRYDGLVKRFVGKDVPATGVSIGVDRLLAALAAAGKLDLQPRTGPVIVTVMDKQRLADYAALAGELRRAGIRAEMYLGDAGFRAQMKYADRRNAPVAVIAGSDEFEAGRVSLKDLFEGKRLSAEIESHEEWRDKSRAQVDVPREGFVQAVKDMIARYDPLDSRGAATKG